jgi:hypothetical protein
MTRPAKGDAVEGVSLDTTTWMCSRLHNSQQSKLNHGSFGIRGSGTCLWEEGADGGNERTGRGSRGVHPALMLPASPATGRQL